MNAKTEEESLIVEMSLDAIAELLDKKLAEQRAHLDAHIARLEGMLLMAIRPVAQVQAAPVQPVATVQPTAPVTQVPVYRDPFLVKLYQPSAYPGWMCKYQDDLAHPVITLDQLAKVKDEGKLGVIGTSPAITRDIVAKYEAENREEIARLMSSIQVWSATAQARKPAAPGPVAPPPAHIPEFNDTIPDFA